MSRFSAGLFFAICWMIVSPVPVWAWGATGHHLINHLAAASLPAEVPAFMRTPRATAEITDLGLELDLLKGAGNEWDAAEDPGHYVDLLGDGTILGGVRLSALPQTREAYDTALRAGGSDQYKSGYLPYSLVQGWQQLRMTLAYWRVDDYESVRATTARLRAISAARRDVDEQLVLRDAGVWGHYVGDACQPLHVTVHFNGWGKYPNPNGYSNSTHLHDLFETVFVDRYVTAAGVATRMTPVRLQASQTLANDGAVMSEVERYLAASDATVPELYRIDKAGGFQNGSPRALAFVEGRLAFGASELRGLIVWAWEDSLNQTIGDDSPQHVRAIVSGNVPYAGLH
ncbi:MAG: S1/P1 Nuclease [Candidatus Baltobacteraceae bacterium]